jgi:hypothetical protein
MRFSFFRLMILIMILLSIESCHMRTNYDRMLNKAIGEYERNKADLGLEDCTFNGPSILKIGKNAKNDTIFVRLGWYYIYKNDSAWIYYEEHIEKKSTDGISFSNVDKLRSDWFDTKRLKNIHR